MSKARLIITLALTLIAGLLISSGHAFAATGNTLIPNVSAGDFNLSGGISFSKASGTGMYNSSSYQLDTTTVENSVTTTFDHTLFVSDGNGNITVSSTGFDSTGARVTQNSDGSTSISYSQSSNAVTTSFNGTLSADGTQMSATYTQQGMGGNTVDNQEFIGGTDISATFTATVNWVSPDQVPAPPSNGQYQLTSNGGVLLSWGASSSSNITGYNIYRLVLGVDTSPQFLTSTSNTSYADESSEAIQNAQSLSGVMYKIYAVGPTGMESSTDVVIMAEENPMNILNSVNLIY